LVAQINKVKNEKKSQQEKLEQFASKESINDKETMTGPIEIDKL